jgi:hypothetical protein
MIIGSCACCAPIAQVNAPDHERAGCARSNDDHAGKVPSRRGAGEKQAMSWQNEVDGLRRREEMARRMGGPDKIRRQHDGGKLTVRERIDCLLDRDSFRKSPRR